MGLYYTRRPVTTQFKYNFPWYNLKATPQIFVVMALGHSVNWPQGCNVGAYLVWSVVSVFEVSLIQGCHCKRPE